MAASPAQRVEEVVSGAVTDLGLVVEDVTITPAGKRRVVRIAVDRALAPGDLVDVADLPEGETQSTIPALDLDAVADATRAVSDALDASDALGNGPYTLEVTSPGVSRPLTADRHFRRNVGRLVRLVLDGDTPTGRLVAAGPDAVRLRAEGGDETTYPLEHITRGDVQVEFGRAEEED
ncbi:MAG: ribosome maturation factor RimP [Micrococcus sp.]|nr:ribosome maturation factor RimP [Micrococcus sp.]